MIRSLPGMICFLVLVLVACGAAAHCPRYCTEQYEPVCGTDGRTYDNNCKLRQAACRGGNTYLKKAHDGPCKTTGNCPDICIALYDPVCGSDGRTYGNSCELRVAACKYPHRGLTIAHGGECETTGNCPEVCIALYDPVCGTDGKTYSNSCRLGVVACKNPHLGLTIAHEGECK